jgi:hypothetical protein
MEMRRCDSDGSEKRVPAAPVSRVGTPTRTRSMGGASSSRALSADTMTLSMGSVNEP